MVLVKVVLRCRPEWWVVTGRQCGQRGCRAAELRVSSEEAVGGRGRELVWRSPTLTYRLLFRLETECTEQNCLTWQTFLSVSDFPLLVVMRKEKGKPMAGNPLCHKA